MKLPLISFYSGKLGYYHSTELENSDRCRAFKISRWDPGLQEQPVSVTLTQLTLNSRHLRMEIKVMVPAILA